jgi:hypothetical protein
LLVDSLMPEAAQRYLEYAAACVRLARQTTDEAQRARLLEMAEAWRKLAMTAGHARD